MKMIGPARLGKDAEIRYAPSGDAVANLSLAMNYGKADEAGNRPTQWINASLWGKRAESLAQYLTKGTMHFFVLSDVHIEAYEGQNGTFHNLVARIDDVTLGPRGQVGTGQDSGGQPQGQQRAARPAQAPRQNAAPAGKPAQRDGFNEMDEDIPF